MENKYYDLIISLIKKHRKYPLYEDILDNIAQDVYEHARVIIESVQNEAVILSYLNKIVSTSIVTVPKRLNYHSRLKNRNALRQISRAALEQRVLYNSSVQTPEPPIQEETSEVTQEFVQQIAEPVIEPLNDIKEDVLETAVSETEPSFENVAIEDIIEEDITEPQETLVEESITESLAELPLEAPSILEDTALEEKEEADYVNKDLVDKMINGVDSFVEEPAASIIENNTTTELITEELSSEFDLEIEQPAETFAETEPESLTEEPEILSDGIDEPLLAETIEETLKDFSIDDIPNELETEDVAETPDLDTGFEQSVEEFSPEVEELSLTENNNEFVLESFEETSDIEQLDVLESIEEAPQDLQELAEDISKPVEFSVPSYNCFGYSPENIENDEDSKYLSEQLTELAKKLPEQKIQSVFELKYNKKMTVKQIAESLDFTEEAVISSLNEIIDLIKD